MSALEEDYLTVPEAATLLRVAPSTVRRWIRQGDVPAYRIGPRRVALRRTDVASLIAPARVAAEPAPCETDIATIKNRKLTPEEKERALESLERAEKHSEELLARRGGKPLRPSREIIDEMRAERTRELMDALG